MKKLAPLLLVLSVFLQATVYGKQGVEYSFGVRIIGKGKTNDPDTGF